MAINKGNQIEMQCPSVMICGGSNFPVRKKEKQNAARERHYKELEYINNYINKLENILYGNEIIKSGDADAIEKLQEKLTETVITTLDIQCHPMQVISREAVNL